MRPDQKVVFIGREPGLRQVLYQNVPPKNKPLTLSNYSTLCTCGCGTVLYTICGYETCPDGSPNLFSKKELRDLDEVLSKISIEELTHQLVEKC